MWLWVYFAIRKFIILIFRGYPVSIKYITCNHNFIKLLNISANYWIIEYIKLLNIPSLQVRGKLVRLMRCGGVSYVAGAFRSSVTHEPWQRARKKCVCGCNLTFKATRYGLLWITENLRRCYSNFLLLY